MTIDSEEKNEEVSIDDDEKWFKHFSTVLSMKKDRKSIDMRLMAGMNINMPISTIAKCRRCNCSENCKRCKGKYKR